jgi:hypothetical protein
MAEMEFENLTMREKDILRTGVVEELPSMFGEPVVKKLSRL